MKGVLICGLLALAAPGGGWAQSSVPDGAELYGEYFGCWTCHGQTGGGGEGQPLRETYLPLALFIKTLRLPAGEMPVFNDILATDVELALVYEWLEGIDDVVVPPPVTVTIDGPREAEPEVETELTVERAPSGTDAGDELGVAGARLRLTLLMRDNTLVAGQPMEQSAGENGPWSPLETDGYGQAWLGTDHATTRVRVALPQGSYVFVVEAVAADETANPTIFGVGTTVVRVE